MCFGLEYWTSDSPNTVSKISSAGREDDSAGDARALGRKMNEVLASLTGLWREVHLAYLIYAAVYIQAYITW